MAPPGFYLNPGKYANQVDRTLGTIVVATLVEPLTNSISANSTGRRRTSPNTARTHSSSLYDVLNNLTTHAVLGRYGRAKRLMVKEHLTALGHLAPSDIPNLVLFDRRYPSADLISFCGSSPITSAL